MEEARGYGKAKADCYNSMQIRKRHEEFPISTGEDYEYLQPTSIIHVGTLNTSLTC